MRNFHAFLPVLAGVAFPLLVGCGGETFSGTDAGESRDAAGHDSATSGDAGLDRDTGLVDSGRDSPSRVDSGRDASQLDTGIDAGPGACPTTQPLGGVLCPIDQLTCEYGDDPQLSCDVVLTCEHNSWVVSQSGPQTPCSTVNAHACPAAFNDVLQGDGCMIEASCDYPEARCSCSVQCFSLCAVEIDGGPNLKTWSCDVPAAPTDCPIPRPRIGSPCGHPDETCDYGACQGNVALQCTGGAWQQAFTACPG